MRAFILPALLAALTACGNSSTDPAPTRYNFGIVDGANQSSTAGTPQLSAPITAQLTRDPQGKFATRVFDLLLPMKAFAQGLTLSGEPIEGQLVCGEEANTGEPRVEPLCAFTLADGKAPNKVQPGTKSGQYWMVFTAQEVGQAPVKDSTTVTVLPGPAASWRFRNSGFHGYSVFPADYVKDQYGNSVPYRMLTTGLRAHVRSDVMGSEGARTLVPDIDSYSVYEDGQGQIVTVEVASGVIATGEITQTSVALNGVTVWFGN